MLPLTPRSTLFPYTTLFRSCAEVAQVALDARAGRLVAAVARGLSFGLELAHARLDGLQAPWGDEVRSEEHTSELQSHSDLVCRLLLEKKNRVCCRRTRGQRA